MSQWLKWEPSSILVPPGSGLSDQLTPVQQWSGIAQLLANIFVPMMPQDYKSGIYHSRRGGGDGSLRNKAFSRQCNNLARTSFVWTHSICVQPHAITLKHALVPAWWQCPDHPCTQSQGHPIPSKDLPCLLSLCILPWTPCNPAPQSHPIPVKTCPYLLTPLCTFLTTLAPSPGVRPCCQSGSSSTSSSSTSCSSSSLKSSSPSSSKTGSGIELGRDLSFTLRVPCTWEHRLGLKKLVSRPLVGPQIPGIRLRLGLLLSLYLATVNSW